MKPRSGPREPIAVRPGTVSSHTDVETSKPARKADPATGRRRQNANPPPFEHKLAAEARLFEENIACK